jgi:hypothetical protein
LSHRPPLHPTPDSCTTALVEAISANELEAAEACFHSTARFLTPDGTIVEGRGAIHSLLIQLVGMRLKVDLELVRQVQVAELALSTETWRVHQTSVTGVDIVRTTSSLALLRCGEIAGWQILFLAPWGFD